MSFQAYLDTIEKKTGLTPRELLALAKDRGFDGPGGSGYGMVGMRERAAGIGGRLEVVTTAGKGTTVFLFGPDQ